MEHEPCLHAEKRASLTKTSGPDGLEAWLVALAACFINFVMAGLGRMSGILYVALIDIFQTDRRQASLPFSLRSSVRNLLGPIVGILGQKYGVRPVIIVGGLIGTVSAASCFYLNDIVWITVVWGAINGIGTSLTTTLPQVVIGQHFKKYRATASGMAFSGGCVGSFVFPVLIEHFLHTYDLGGTFLLIAGFIMHVIPAALILKKPSWWKDEEEIQIQAINCETEEITHTTAFHRENEETEKSVEFVDKNLSQTDTGFTEPNGTPFYVPVHFEQNVAREQLFKSEVDSEFLWENRDILIKLLTNNLTLQYQQSEIKHNNFLPTDDASIKEIELLLRKLETNVPNHDNNLVLACPSVSLKNEAELTDKPQNMHLTNGSVKPEVKNKIDLISINYTAFYLGKFFERDRSDILQNFPEDQHKSINKIIEELEKLHNILTSYGKNTLLCSRLPNDLKFLPGRTKSVKSSSEQSNTFFTHIKTAFNLYTKPLFLLICLCRSAHFLTFLPVVTIIVDFSMDRGLLSEDGKYVIAALSLGDLLGRLCFGWITDRGYISLPKYMLYVMVLQGAATVTLPFMQTRAYIMTSIAVFGLLQGSAFVRHPVLVSRYLGNHEQFIAMGCINFFSGLIGLILPVYIGFFRDTIGAYDGLFYINGAIGAFIGLLWVFEPYFLKLSSASGPSGNQATDV